jgi:glycosyltransferase involved in cell wall biosynthesis
VKIANIMLGEKRGGIEQAAVDYCLALRSMGHDITAIIRADAAVTSSLTNAKIHCVTICNPHTWNPIARRKISRALATCDIAILHGNRAAKLTSSQKHLRQVGVAHSRFFTPYQHFDAIVALSAQRADMLKEEYKGPIHIIPNMLDMPPLRPRPARRSPPVIGIMGRLSHEKGFDLLIAALGILRAQHIPFRAIIGGDGAERERLMQQAAALKVDDAIEWLGWVNDKTDFFERIDLYCMASRTENFPITLLEAMSHGCPVISTDCGGPSAMLEGHCGILTPITAEGIAKGLAEALQNPEAMAVLGTRARNRVAAHYTTPIVAARLHEVLTGL